METSEDRQLLPGNEPLKASDIYWLRKFINNQCVGIHEWHMSVPVDTDDSDMILCRVLKHLEKDQVTLNRHKLAKVREAIIALDKSTPGRMTYSTAQLCDEALAILDDLGVE